MDTDDQKPSGDEQGNRQADRHPQPANMTDEARAGHVAESIEEIPAADGAVVMTDLPSDQAADVAEYLDPDTAAGIIAHMEPEDAASVLTDMEPGDASMVLSSMDPDDRVDVLEHVSPALHKRLVGELSTADAEEVRQLEQYPRDTAGGIMTTQVTALPEDLNVEQAIKELRRINEEMEQMFYVYVVDRRRHLIGVLSMRDLILARPERRLADIMIPNVASVPATMDQEEVARQMRRLGYMAMPVVDDRHRLLGLITVDDIVDVIQEEATEDIQKMFGAGAEERLLSPWQFSFRKRVWWLEVNLLTAFMAAWVISRFDTVIAALPILAAYQSIVSGMGGNAGAQALAVAIRGIALGESKRNLIWQVLYREAILGILTGLTIGATCWLFAILGIFGRSQYQQHAMLIGLVVCLALLFNHLNACTTGALIPFAMKRLGFDPAQSATIFATTFTDCGGFFATLWLAKVILHLH